MGSCFNITPNLPVTSTPFSTAEVLKRGAAVYVANRMGALVDDARPRRTGILTTEISPQPSPLANQAKEDNMSDGSEKSACTNALRPLTIETSETELEALRDRIAATRWPSKELVTDRSQGVQLATIQELARYWATDYDWRQCQARLTRRPSSRRRSTASTSTSST